jgi:hypothetical protein
VKRNRPECLHQGTWNAADFGAGLAAALVPVLTGAHDAGNLIRMVNVCAAAAEEVCEGRPMACAAGCPPLLRQAAYDEAFRVLARTMGDHGLDNRSIELSSGILAFLENPDYRDLLCRGGRLPDDPWT